MEARAPLRNERRHLLGIESLDAEEIQRILRRARELREVTGLAVSAPLRGVSVVTLFYEASTRTRASFEIAAQQLGASIVSLAASSTSVSKGESLWDTGRTLSAMDPGVIICRHSSAGAPLLLARAVESVGETAVVNAGD